ncbi:MAG: hypothetical protein WCP15_02505 [bacterium]
MNEVVIPRSQQKRIFCLNLILALVAVGGFLWVTTWSISQLFDIDWESGFEWAGLLTIVTITTTAFKIPESWGELLKRMLVKVGQNMVNVYEYWVTFGVLERYHVVSGKGPNLVFFFSNPLPRVDKDGKEKTDPVSLNDTVTQINDPGSEFELDDGKYKITPDGAKVTWAVDPDSVETYFLNRIGNDLEVMGAVFGAFFRFRLSHCKTFSDARQIKWGPEFRTWFANNTEAQGNIRRLGVKIISLQVKDVNKDKAMQSADNTAAIMAQNMETINSSAMQLYGEPLKKLEQYKQQFIEDMFFASRDQADIKVVKLDQGQGGSGKKGGGKKGGGGDKNSIVELNMNPYE